MKQETALVTGVAGFVGSHLAERLLSEGFRVVGIDSFTDYYPRHHKEANLEGLRRAPGFTLVEGDLQALDLPALLRREDVRCILHQAGQAGVRASWGQHFEEYVTRNILATQALLEAARGLDLTRFVFASSSSVYGDAERLPTSEGDLPRPVSPYGVTKLAAEHLSLLYAKQYGVPAVALRYFTVYGPRQRPDMAFRIFIHALLQDQPIRLLGDGEQTREFTYVSDIVEANLLALKSPGATERVYNIGGGARVTMNAAVRLLGELMETTPRIDYQPRAAGDHRHGAADITRARQELGYQPAVSLEEGLRRQVAWQRAPEVDKA
ncbi:MAG: NAD-dependent epimerase/dehydratase family protein [Anaerolineae bacterium]